MLLVILCWIIKVELIILDNRFLGIVIVLLMILEMIIELFRSFELIWLRLVLRR